MNRRPLRRVGVLLALATAVAACTPSEGDFASEAERFIQGDEVAAWADGLTFTGAVCDDPGNTTVNTEFQCTAAASDGNRYVFQVRITAERQFRVLTVQPSG